MTVEQAIQLIGVSAWPFAALVAVFALRPYLAQVARAAGDLRELLNRSGEMVDLVAQVSALNEATSDLKAMQVMERAGRPDATAPPTDANVDALWKRFEAEWQETRDAFRSVAKAAGVPVSFFGTVKVREAGKALFDKGILDEPTANGVADLSAQYQYLSRTTADRSELLNENVVAAYAKAAARVRATLKSS